MRGEIVYTILWRSAVDSDQTRLREDKFTGEEEAVRFIKGLERSRHRTFVRCQPKINIH